MKTYVIIVACALMLSPIQLLHGQHETESHEESGHHGELKNWRVAPFVGYTLIPTGNTTEANLGIVIAPTVGIDFEYWFSHTFGIGLFSDLELTSYVLEGEGELEGLKREFAFVSALVANWEPLKGWALFLGPGVELEANKNFMVIKVGTSYSFAFQNDWDLAITCAFDSKIAGAGYYNAISLGLNVGKRF